MQKKNELVSFLYKRGHIKKDDNIYYAQTAFKAQAVISWCMKQGDQEIFYKSLLLLERFLSGAIDINIINDKLVVRRKRKKKK